MVYQNGQGDLACYNGSAFVTGTKAGSTKFLANPAATLFNGDIQSGADGVYLNPYETVCSDGGFDVACVGIVNNFNRTVSTGAKSAVWIGYRGQSIGSSPMDALITATGTWKNGLDLSMMTLDANQSAISLKQFQRIYFNNTALASGSTDGNWFTTGYGGDYLHYSNVTNTGLHAVVGGNDILTMRSDALVSTSANGFVLQSTGILRFVGTGQYTTGAQTATFSATNKPGTTSSGPTQWLTVNLGGVIFYIPCFPA